MTSLVLSTSADRSKMSSFFGMNPFATQVGQLIEQATDGSLASENWGLNMEICDAINETDEGPKDAIKAIKKRLSTNAGKNYNVVMYSLTVLETCVKNCGKRFHVHVANKDFLGELIKIIGPKNDPPQVVQEKILSLIQTWADAFKGIPDFKEVGKVYQDLKKKGIEFPMTDLGTMAPIHTPARVHADADSPANRTPTRTPTRASKYMVMQEEYEQDPPQSVNQRPPAQAPGPGVQVGSGTGPVNLSAEQLAKLRSELDVVEQNCKVFSEMLTEMSPGQEDRSDLELLQELHRTCRQMQQRIVELLDRVANEEVTGELLRVNDDLNNVFLRYERFERYRTGQTGPPTAVTPPTAAQQNISNAATLPMRGPPPPVPPQQAAGEGGVGNLIDLETPPTHSAAQTQSPFAPASSSDIQQRLAGMNIGGSTVSSQLGQINTTTATNAAPPDEFDMFAQSRQSFDTSKGQVGPGQANPGIDDTYANQHVDQQGGSLGAAVQAKTNTDQMNEDEIERPQDKDRDYDEMEKWLTENATQQESATSSEFDRFLAERAQEAESLPDTAPGSRGNQRKMQKDDQENALFAL